MFPFFTAEDIRLCACCLATKYEDWEYFPELQIASLHLKSHRVIKVSRTPTKRGGRVFGFGGEKLSFNPGGEKPAPLIEILSSSTFGVFVMMNWSCALGPKTLLTESLSKVKIKQINKNRVFSLKSPRPFTW